VWAPFAYLGIRQRDAVHPHIFGKFGGQNPLYAFGKRCVRWRNTSTVVRDRDDDMPIRRNDPVIDFKRGLQVRARVVFICAEFLNVYHTP
jgi:hypothetical protein